MPRRDSLGHPADDPTAEEAFQCWATSSRSRGLEGHSIGLTFSSMNATARVLSGYEVAPTRQTSRIELWSQCW